MIIPLLYYAAIGVVLHFNRGAYSDGGLAIVFLGWLAAVAGGLVAKSRWNPAEARAESLIWSTILVFAFFLARNDMILKATSEPAHQAVVMLLGAGLGLAGAGLGSSILKPIRSDRLHLTLCLLLGFCLLLARLMTLHASPDPHIDVFTISTAATDFLRKGINPYAQTYPDIYNGVYGYASTYNYWPGALLPEAICRWAFGDIRIAFVIADLVTAASLAAIARTLHWPKRLVILLPLLWLSFPVALFVLDQAWIDTFLIATATLFTLFALRGRWLGAGLALGYFCATKQYAVFFAILSGVALVTLRIRRELSSKGLLECAGGATAVFAALMLPFALWDWSAFYANTIGKFLIMPARSDALSFVGAIKNASGHTLPGALCAAIYLLALAGASAAVAGLPRGRSATWRIWSTGLVLAYGATFLFGKEAFCNYYDLLAFFVLIQAVLSLELSGGLPA